MAQILFQQSVFISKSIKSLSLSICNTNDRRLLLSFLYLMQILFGNRFLSAHLQGSHECVSVCLCE